MRQFKFTALHAITVIILAVATFTACKKDAFSEKDAIAAQTALLQTKFSFDVAIKQVDLQIQRSGDSAKIVIQNLINSGATALEILKQTNMMAQILQNQNNFLAQLRYQDSLNNNKAVLDDKISRARTLWQDSVDKAKSNAVIAANLQKNYSISFSDNITGQPLVGATVSVLPYGSATFATTTTNAQGVASFINLVVDPGTFFSATATGYALALVRESSLTSTFTTSNGNVITTFKSNPAIIGMYNLANTRNTIRGSVLGDVNLANGDATEAIVGQLVMFTSSITVSGITTIYQYSALSDASGNYSVSVPDANYTPVYPATIRVQQKLFVNAWTDQDQTTVLPRIDETGTTLQSYGGFTPVTNGVGTAIYYTFSGADSLTPTRSEFAAQTTTSTTIFTTYNTQFSPINPSNTLPSGSFVARVNGSPRTDSLGNYNFLGSPIYFNNQTVAHPNDNTVIYSQKSNYRPAKTQDTLTVTLVSLLPGWIVTAPKLIAPVDGTTGKINSILLAKTPGLPFGGPTAGSGGVFNPAVMYTASNRQAFINLTGVYGPYVASLATTVAGANSTSLFTLTGGNSYYLPIEYRNTVARDKTPR